jgi:hypothetical protein
LGNIWYGFPYENRAKLYYKLLKKAPTRRAEEHDFQKPHTKKQPIVIVDWM